MKTQKMNYMGLVLTALLMSGYTSCKKDNVVDNTPNRQRQLRVREFS